MAGKIALIANGINATEFDPLETILRRGGAEVDVFDVRNIKQTATGFEVTEAGATKAIDPNGYQIVTRSIMGGNPGDSKKSWPLQKYFEDHGAKPHVSVAASERITDRIASKALLNEKKVPAVDMVTLGETETKDRATLEAAITMQLGDFPMVVRKSLGSGKDSFVVADNMNEAMVAAEKFHNPIGDNPVKSGVLFHALPPKLDDDTVRKYGLLDVTEPEKRSYQFRVVVVEGKPFGTNIVYSEPGKFGLNPAQGAKWQPIAEELVPPPIMVLARKAADAHGLKIAAVDIALDKNGAPRVLDMNTSPDLSFANARGELLKYELAKSIQGMIAEGRHTGGVEARGRFENPR